jgi:DNA-binding XRE family transcriptional regulator
MEQNWKAVAEAIRASRMAQGMTQEGLAATVGVSRVTIQSLESGSARTRVSTALLEVARILGWPNGHVEELLSGGESALPVRNVRKPRRPERTGLPLRITKELDQGQTYDAQVLDLPGESGARIIVVVKGDSDATPEQVEEALLAWRRMARKMQQAGTDDE